MQVEPQPMFLSEEDSLRARGESKANELGLFEAEEAGLSQGLDSQGTEDWQGLVFIRHPQATRPG